MMYDTDLYEIGYSYSIYNSYSVFPIKKIFIQTVRECYFRTSI